MNKISRRRFINGTCYKIGLYIGLSYFAGRVLIPKAIAQTDMSDTLIPTNPAIDINEQKKFRRRILIAYASQFGSTGEIAERIAARLNPHGHQIDLMRVDQVESLDNYDAIIIGGAIQYDRWMGKARNFIEKHKLQLEKIPCACFFSCLTLSRHDDASAAQAQGYARGISQLFTNSPPIVVRGFAGVLDYSKMSIPVRLVAKVILSIIGVKQGDYRNWLEIDNWADTLNARIFDNSLTKNKF